MPDFAMCANDAECPLRQTCRRSEASGTRPTPRRQSYMGFKPGRDCADYWSLPRSGNGCGEGFAP